MVFLAFHNPLFAALGLLLLFLLLLVPYEMGREQQDDGWRYWWHGVLWQEERSTRRWRWTSPAMRRVQLALIGVIISVWALAKVDLVPALWTMLRHYLGL